MQRFLRRKKPVGGCAVVAQPSFQFHGSRWAEGLGVRNGSKWLKTWARNILVLWSSPVQLAINLMDEAPAPGFQQTGDAFAGLPDVVIRHYPQILRRLKAAHTKATVLPGRLLRVQSQTAGGHRTGSFP
jgi:hypothetical protein